jgi:hypothetical protein
MKMRPIAALALAGALSHAAAAQTAQSGQSPPNSLQPTIRENRIVTPPKDGGGTPEPQPNAVPGRSVESMVSSTQDLNAIRDGYLRALSGDGCAPDVAARVAELRALLGEKKPEGSPAAGGQAAPAGKSAADLESSMLALALDWYNRPAADNSSIASANPAAREAERAQLLEAALTPRQPQGVEARNSVDAAVLKSELQRLLASCHSPRR